MLGLTDPKSPFATLSPFGSLGLRGLLFGRLARIGTLSDNFTSFLATTRISFFEALSLPFLGTPARILHFQNRTHVFFGQSGII
jgi:hypothetical protein